MDKITKTQNFILDTYLLLVCILSLAVLPVVYIIRLVLKKDVSSWKTKLGRYVLSDKFDKSKKTIVVHGVSVGEIVSLEKLIKKIKHTFPNCNLVITTGTKTGQETAIKKTGDFADYITYLPLDLPYPVKKFLDITKPAVVLMAETEIWPTFAIECNKRKIPLFIINGRISDNSYKSYKILRPFFECILPLYTGIFTQSELDRSRFEKLGARKNSLEVMKNLKFDIKKTKDTVDIDKNNRKILIAGSTHHGEEEIVVNAFKKLKSKDKKIKLLLAPRHITRMDDVIRTVEKAGLTYNLYSKVRDFGAAEVLLLDVMGELAKLYQICDAAFIGGSFSNNGGHNPLEAAVFNKPVISGPSIKNFRDIYAALTGNNAAFIVKSEEELYSCLERLFFDKDFYCEIVKNTEDVFEGQKGALSFVIGKLGEIIK